MDDDGDGEGEGAAAIMMSGGCSVRRDRDVLSGDCDERECTVL